MSSRHKLMNCLNKRIERLKDISLNVIYVILTVIYVILTVIYVILTVIYAIFVL